MGLSFSEPAFASTSAGWLVLFGNGYNSPTQKPFLYALDPHTGTVRGKVDLCAAVPTACNTALANGLSSVSVVNSYGQVSAFANMVYAGDLQGNLWRVDITNSNPANWVVTVIFQARDSSSIPQPITTIPAVTLNPLFPQILGTMVMIGTGQLLGLPDLSTTQVQTLYGIFDAPTGASPPVGFAGIPTRNNLVKQTLVAATVGTVAVRTMPTQNPVTIPTNRGWYVDFSLAAGERLITNPQIEAGGGVVVTSYQPNVSSCTGGGNSWLTVLSFATGGSFPLPELDINGDGFLNTGDVATGVNGGNPVSMSLGPVYASAATIVPSGGPASARKLMSVSNVQVKSVADRGETKQRTAWWEIRH
jgi:type IV pilus assembly protein PilY1